MRNSTRFLSCMMMYQEIGVFKITLEMMLEINGWFFNCSALISSEEEKLDNNASNSELSRFGISSFTNQETPA